MHKTHGRKQVSRLSLVSLTVAFLIASSLRATTVIPISDAELYLRAEVVVHGVVVSSDVTVDRAGRPETLTVVEPIEVLKGRLPGSLVLHQAGGTLPDGRFFKLWGRPEYVPGREVIVFAIAAPDGEFQTAEMLLGKFEVWQDGDGNRFAVPDLAINLHSGVEVRRPAGKFRSGAEGDAQPDPAAILDGKTARPLGPFLFSLRGGSFETNVAGYPLAQGLQPVVHEEPPGKGVIPRWGNLSNTLYRWNNNATAVWTLSGTANITGGGIAEANASAASWTNDPNSTINYTVGSGTNNVIYLNATTSTLGCGWSTCLSGGGVIGCGGVTGLGGTNSWRGENYSTITRGTVELRSYCSMNLYSSAVTQSVLTHELGHTLGLGHSDQNVSPHDVCRGDENAAIMRSVVQNYASLQTDDQDAIRWIYGDGLNSCTASAPPPSVTGATPTLGPTTGGSLVTITGSGFAAGATVSFGGSAATGVIVVNATTITAVAPSHSAGSVNVVVTNPDTQTGTLYNGFTYSAGAAFYSVAPCRVIDTRRPPGSTGGPALAAGADRTFTIANQCGIPAGARSIASNVTVTNPSSDGYLTIRPGGTPPATVSVINYRAGQTRANNVTVPLGSLGDLIVSCGQITGTVDFIVDVNGYFQ